MPCIGNKDTMHSCPWTCLAWEIVVINGNGDIIGPYDVPVFTDARAAWAFCDRVNDHCKSRNALIPEPRSRQWLCAQGVAFRQGR